MRLAFHPHEVEIRRAVRKAFRRCRIYCRRDRGGYVARIDLPTRSWCSARGVTRAAAVKATFELACEPAPGFPGWVEPAPAPAAADELVLD